MYITGVELLKNVKKKKIVLVLVKNSKEYFCSENNKPQNLIVINQKTENEHRDEILTPLDTEFMPHSH
jgi:hypothetical protein